MLNSSVKKAAYKIIYWQLILIMGLALILFLFKGIQNGVSAFLGGLAYWLPTVLFLLRTLMHSGARAAKRFVATFFIGEVFKLFMSALLFVLIVKYLPVTVLSVLAGYIAAIIVFWAVSVYFLSGREGVRL